MNEKPKEAKRLTIFFRDSVSSLGEATSASIGSKGVTRISPARFTSDGFKDEESGGNGLLIYVDGRTPEGKPQPMRVFVPLSNVKDMNDR